MSAAAPNSESVIQMHLTPPDRTASCDDLDPARFRAEEVVLKGVGGPWQLWVLVSGTQGLTAVGFSILADPGVKIAGWNQCGDMDAPVRPWPQSGGSVTVAWSECQQPANGIVPVGYFLLDEGSLGSIRIQAHREYEELEIVDCHFYKADVPDSCTGTVAVWPDSMSYRLKGLAWHPPKPRPAPAVPDSVILAREAAARKSLVLPPAAAADSSAKRAEPN
jgi:hypothetical protein